MKLQDIKHTLGADTISKKNAVITIRRSYYYRMGKSEQTYINKVKALFPNAIIVASGDNWAPFRGGQSVAQGSHFFVKFTIPDARY